MKTFIDFNEAMRSNLVRTKMQQLAGGPDKMPKGQAFRDLMAKAKDEIAKERAAKGAAAKPAPAKTPGKGGKGDDDLHIISQLRKAQDSDGNYEISFMKGVGRLPIGDIDILLRAYNKLNQQGKIQLIGMVKDLASAKKVAASLKGKV